MLKLETFKANLGFGDGSKYGAGEYYYSQGMRRSQHGLVPGWKVTEVVNNSTLTDLVLSTFYAQAYQGSSMYVYKVDNAGNIFQALNGTGSWALGYKPGVSTHGNGLIGDQKGRLLYLTERYLGLYDGTANYTTGTIAVTNGSANVVGTGTTFVAGDVDRRIVINGVWYTIATFTDATHIVLSTTYAGTTASGLSYAIYRGWNDKYKDFGLGSLAVNTDFRDADTYEDWVVAGNGHDVAVYNITDNSFNASGLTFPSNFKLRSVRSGRTGVLLGLNTGDRSVLVLWDVNTPRSIAPWIWLKGNIQFIRAYQGNWIVVTDREILLTNGYKTVPLPSIPDGSVESVLYNTLPQGGEVVGNRLIMGNSLSSVTRLRAGVWILDLTTELWEFVPVASGATHNNTMGAVFVDSLFRVHVAWKTEIPTRYYLGYLSNETPTSAFVITSPMGVGSGKKTAIGLHPDLTISSSIQASYPISFSISVKACNLKRQLWNYAQQKVAGGNVNEITVNGTTSGSNDAQVGDEVTILEGAYAGTVAHITNISGSGTATEVWTIDTSLAGSLEQFALVSVTPFQLMKKTTVTSLTQLRELYFDCKQSLQGRHYLLKLLIEGLTNTQPELIAADFYYNDTGADLQ